jgi:hypothetical protein
MPHARPHATHAPSLAAGRAIGVCEKLVATWQQPQLQRSATRPASTRDTSCTTGAMRLHADSTRPRARSTRLCNTALKQLE